MAILETLQGIMKLRDAWKKIERNEEAINNDVRNLQTQVNTLVVSGDSSPAADQARVDAGGRVYPSLKNRIDTEYTSISTQITQVATQTNQTIEATNTRIDTLIIKSGDANAEVTDAHISTTKNKSYTTVRNRLEDIEQDTFYPVFNHVSNGNFLNTTGWTPTSSTNTAVNNTLSNTSGGTSASPGVYHTSDIDVVSGKQYFYKARVRVTNSNATRIRLRISGTVSVNTVTVIEQLTPVNNQWYELSGVVTITNQTGKLRCYVLHDYADAAASNGKVLQVQYAIVIALDDFEPNKPSLAEVNNFLGKYTNRWFDKSANLFNAKEVMLSLDDVLGAFTDDGTDWEVGE